MTIDQFYLINTYLKLGNPDPNDKLARIREISNQIELFSRRKNLSIDESMIAYKGKHSLKQYMPMKPTKWGFKAFLLCEATTGYVLRHKFFTGPGQIEFKPQNLSLELCLGLEN